MKTVFTAFGFLIFAILMLPALIKPPADALAADKAQVEALANALGAALIEYHGVYDEFPEGEHREVLKKLKGKNKKEVVFFESPPDSLSDDGEFLDPWGTPFRIEFDHAQKLPRIHSAGPNRVFEGHSAMNHMFSDDYRNWR